MITITQLQPIAVLFTIPEDSLPDVVHNVRAGAKLPADAYNRDMTQKLASGTLVTLDNQIDSTTGTSKLKAVFNNQDNKLFPQQFVNIRLLVDTLTNQLVVPNVAVQNGQQGTFLYVVDEDSRVHLKTVQVGIATETSTDILSGISDGDRVVVDGTDRLVEGAVVRARAGEAPERPRKAAPRRARVEAQGSESIAHLHPAARRHIAADGRGGAGWDHSVPSTAGLGAAPGRLPNHTNPDVLPGRQPGGGDVFHHRAAREAVRPGARTDADDVDQFL
jgi:multidrug efflux system membrane fusion protein